MVGMRVMHMVDDAWRGEARFATVQGIYSCLAGLACWVIWTVWSLVLPLFAFDTPSVRSAWSRANLALG